MIQKVQPLENTYIIFNEIALTISDDDLDYLCKQRFFTDNPTIEDIQREFVTGTGITPNKKHLWSEANMRFKNYIDELRDIQKLDINDMAESLIIHKGRNYEVEKFTDY